MGYWTRLFNRVTHPAPPPDLHDFVTVLSVEVFKYALEAIDRLIENAKCQDVLGGTEPHTLNVTGYKIVLEWVASHCTL